MKLLVLFFVAAVWLQLHTEGKAETNENQIENPNKVSDRVKEQIRGETKSNMWRATITMLATPELRADPGFRERWSIKTEEVPTIICGYIPEFYTSNAFKAMIAFLSTKAELMNPIFRNAYGMGDVSNDVENSDEDGNFFQGPQWMEFLRWSNVSVDKNDDDLKKEDKVLDWFHDNM